MECTETERFFQNFRMIALTEPEHGWSALKLHGSRAEARLEVLTEPEHGWSALKRGHLLENGRGLLSQSPSTDGVH